MIILFIAVLEEKLGFINLLDIHTINEVNNPQGIHILNTFMS